jgi:O-antigen ligase
MRRISAILLLILIAASIAVMWITAKWATTIPEVGAFALAALWTLLFISRRESPRLSVVLLLVAGVIFWAGFQLLIGSTVYRLMTWLGILYWGANLAILFVALQIFSDVPVLKQFLRYLLIFGFFVSILSSLQSLTTNSRIFWIFPTEFASWNLMGPFVYHNQFAAFIELLLPIALYNALTENKWRAFDILIAATMYASVIVSASRMGFALVTAELLIVPGILIRRRNLRLTQVVAGAGVLAGMVVILTLAVGPEILAEKFALKDQYAIRREFVLSSLQMFKDKPLLGVGLGNWPTAYPRYALYDDGRYANQAHNDWAQWAVEGGAPLLLLQLALAFWAIPKALRSGWGTGIAAVLLHCFVDYPIQRPAVALVFFALLGAIAAQLAKDDESPLLHLV